MRTSDIIQKALILFSQQRGHVYRVLATAFDRSPDQAILASLCSLQASPQLFTLHSHPQIANGLKKIKAWHDRAALGLSGEMIGLSAEFTRLFRGIKRFDSLPPPYESVYMDRGVLFGPSTEAVLQFYRRFGLDTEKHEPPDNVAFELDFMSHLCGLEGASWEREGEAQELLNAEEAFLDEHLAKWVPELSKNISSATDCGFYDGLADVLQGWISADREAIVYLSAAPTEGITP